MVGASFHADGAVVAAFPSHHFAVAVEDEELVLGGGVEVFSVDGSFPHGEFGITHGHSLGGVPFAEGFGSAADGQVPVGLQHGSGHGEGDVTLTGKNHFALFGTLADTFSEGGRVVGLVPGLVLPAVVHGIVASATAAKEAVGGAPFAFAAAVFVAHFVMIGEISEVIGELDGDAPVLGTLELERESFDVLVVAEGINVAGDVQRFAPVGAVVDIEG